MINHRWLVLLVLAMASSSSLAATQPAEKPEKDMLRMIDFLKDWEMINNMEMMKDMQQVAPEMQVPPRSSARIPAPARKSEAAK